MKQNNLNIFTELNKKHSKSKKKKNEYYFKTKKGQLCVFCILDTYVNGLFVFFI